jgi:adenylyl-sulfate kinase
MPTLMSGDAPMGGSQAKYAQVAQDEGAKPLEVEAPSGPLGSGAPPVMRKPAFWAAVLVVALGASVMLSGPASPPPVVEAAPETDVPATTYSTPTLRGTEDSTLTALIAENSRLRADLASKGTGGASDEAFSALFEENGRLRAELAQKPASTGGEFDIGAYRAERLAATPPNIIECAEANAGESQEACHLPKERRFEAIQQKGITLWMTGLSGSGKSTIARALEEALVLKYGKVVQQLDGDNVRTGLNRDLGFTPADRDESVRRVGELACLFNGGGVITLVTLVSPYRAARDAARQRHEEQHLKFLEVFMNVPIDEVRYTASVDLLSRRIDGVWGRAGRGWSHFRF